MAKILLYTLLFSPDQVSNAYVLANLVRGLRDLGHEIKVLTTTPHYQTLPEELEKQPLAPYRGKWLFKSDFEGTPCYHIKVPPKKGKLFQRIVTSFLFHVRSLRMRKWKELDCDLVLSVTPPPTIGVVGPLLASPRRAKTINVVCDLLSVNFIEGGRTEKSFFVRLLRFLETQTYRANDAIVAVTGSSADLIRERSPEKLIVEEISDSVDTGLYFPLPRENEYSAENGWNDKFVVSYVGNLGKAQDFSAIPEVVSRCMDIPAKFIFAGSGLKYEELCESAKKLRNPAWEVWEHQPLPATAKINASSDLCLVLLSSFISKGSFPSKLYTIMACGRPVLFYGPCQSDIGRLIREHDLGWTVETGDVDGFVQAIREAHADPERRTRMGSNGLKLVENKYSAQAVARQYDALIRRVLNEQ